MEKKDKKILKRLSFVTISMVVLFLIFLMILGKVFSKIGEPIEYSKTILFEETKESIVIKARTWGLMGDHNRITIYNEGDDSRNNDLNFNISEMYYKQHGADSLFIYKSSGSYIEEKISFSTIGCIKIKIIEFKISKYNDYENNYKAMGLSRISADYGIE